MWQRGCDWPGSAGRISPRHLPRGICVVFFNSPHGSPHVEILRAWFVSSHLISNVTSYTSRCFSILFFFLGELNVIWYTTSLQLFPCHYKSSPWCCKEFCIFILFIFQDLLPQVTQFAALTLLSNIQACQGHWLTYITCFHETVLFLKTVLCQMQYFVKYRNNVSSVWY